MRSVLLASLNLDEGNIDKELVSGDGDDGEEAEHEGADVETEQQHTPSASMPGPYRHCHLYPTPSLTSK